MNKSKKSLLLEAHTIITGERAKTYGPSGNGMEGIALQWSLYLQQKYGITNEYGAPLQLTAEDACWMMADLKKYRQMHKSKRDHVVDAAGYIGLIESVL